jgi:hypothetical protein
MRRRNVVRLLYSRCKFQCVQFRLFSSHQAVASCRIVDARLQVTLKYETCCRRRRCHCCGRQSLGHSRSSAGPDRLRNANTSIIFLHPSHTRHIPPPPPPPTPPTAPPHPSTCAAPDIAMCLHSSRNPTIRRRH